MSTIIKFDLKELRKLATDKNSCIVEKKVTQNLALQPWCLGNLKESIKNLLDYKIGKFEKEFNGILLSYKNLRILQNVGSIRNDNADIHFQVQADYFIFQPHVGATLKGIVNKKSPTHLGILVHRVFNVVIPRPTEEPGNKWIGMGIEEGQHVMFQIVVLDLFGALPYIRGELDERWLKLGPEEDELDETNVNQHMNVSYVNFDKTKPILQKQIGDEITNSSKASKNHSKLNSSSKSQVKNISQNKNENKDNSDPGIYKKIESNGSIVEKTKSKRQSKIMEGETTKQSNNGVSTTKQSKKHKRDS